MSVREVAADLRRRADGLYFHVHQLLEAGLVLADGERRLARHTETLYRVPTGLRLQYDLSDAATRDALASMAAAMLRVARRDFERAVELDNARSQGPARNLWNARVVGWVTHKQAAQINELLNQILDVLGTESRTTDRAERVSLVWSLAPLGASLTGKEGSQ